MYKLEELDRVTVCNVTSLKTLSWCQTEELDPVTVCNVTSGKTLSWCQNEESHNVTDCNVTSVKIRSSLGCMYQFLLHIT